MAPRSRADSLSSLLRAFLVQGSYPTALLAAWDEFKQAQSPPCDDQIKPRKQLIRIDAEYRTMLTVLRRLLQTFFRQIKCT